jgi:hypothetical protein
MKNLLFTMFLISGSIMLAACDNEVETHIREFTVTHSELREVDGGESTSIFFAYMHADHASEWAAYERATHEICALIKSCAIAWFAGKAPGSITDLAQNKDAYSRVASMSMENYELATSLIDCDYIDEPQPVSDPNKAKAFCMVNQQLHESRMQGLDPADTDG